MGFLKGNLGRIVFGVSALTLWEAIARIGWMDTTFVSLPSQIGVRLYKMAITGVLWKHTWATLEETFLGFIIGVVLGVGSGIILANFRKLGHILDPYLMALYGTPKVALAPLFLVWFGIGLVSKVAFVTVIVFFLVIFNTIAGIISTDPYLIRAMKALGATDRQIMWKLKLPFAVPWIFTGVKMAIGMALIGAVVAEFIGAQAGLGYYIVFASGMFDVTGLFAGIIILAILAMLINEGVKYVQNKILSWKPDYQ